MRPWLCRRVQHYAEEVATARPGPADAGRAQYRRGGGAGDWQRPAHGLLRRGADDAPGGAHGTARHPGSILLTADTLRLVEGLVQVTALGPVPVKGLTEPVEVFELVGASALRRRLQAAAARGLTRFVGRQTELEALQQALERAGAGHGQVVALVGEAGVGKSAWSMSSSTPTRPRAGGCWRAPRCPTAKPPPTSR